MEARQSGIRMFFKNIDKDYWQHLGNASVMGLHLVSGTFVGLLIGYYLDKWLGTKPWLTLFFLIMGIIAGFKNMFHEFKKIQKKDEEKEKADGS